MANKFVSKEDVITKVKIIDLAKEFGIELESVTSGKFNYRCRCPSPDHKSGNERTPSLYINATENDFMCYGCGCSLNSIDFYMLCTGLNFGEAIAELKKRVKPGSQQSFSYDIETNNYFILLEISKLLRLTMLSHLEDLEWIDKLMNYSDRFILNIDSKDDKKAKLLLKKIQNKIDKRYGV